MLAVVEWSILGCLVAGLFLWYRQRPLPTPASLGNSVESPYYEVYTDLDGGQAEFYTTFFNEFFRYFEREYFPVHQGKKLKVFLFGNPAAYREYVEKKFKTIVINHASGLGTATHELVHHFMATADLDYYPDWISEGFPAFFEKFIGYIDPDGRLHISLGYFSNWRFPLTKKVIDQYTMEALFKTRDQSVARSFNLFLHKHRHLNRFIQTLYTERGKADPIKTLEAVYGADLKTIEGEWKSWVRSQPLDANVKLVNRSFVLPYEKWVSWWEMNRENLTWDDEKRLYVVRGL